MVNGIQNPGRSIPGPDANLPHFIYDRMVALNMRPTLTQLAREIGTSHNVLQTYLKGEREMKLSTAKKLVAVLEIDSIDTLIKEMPFLCEAE